MPKYLDHHAALNLPPQVVQQIAAGVKSGRPDPATGVKGINTFMAKNEAWCLTEAPNPAAVRKMHEAFGVSADKCEVTEVTSLV